MRIDKYDPKDGGFRAPIKDDTSKTSAGNAIGVGLDSSGRVVPGAGNTGIMGILALTSDKKAGEIVDVMTDGEMVEAVGLTAGTTYYAAVADGVISDTATGVRVGHTVEATRLVVRLGRGGAGEDSEDDLSTQAALVALTNSTGQVGDDVVANVEDVAAAAASATAAATPAASAFLIADADIDDTANHAGVEAAIAAGVDAAIDAATTELVANVDAAIDAATLDVITKVNAVVAVIEADVADLTDKVNEIIATLAAANVTA